MNNYDMVASPGRTYRYYRGKPLFEFGAGLSLTTFSLAASCVKADPGRARGRGFTCTARVTNTGTMAGDEVVMVFDALSGPVRKAAAAAGHPVPIKRLVDFGRVSVDPGAAATITFDIDQAALGLTTADGSKKPYPGVHNLVFSRGNGADVTVAVELGPSP